MFGPGGRPPVEADVVVATDDSVFAHLAGGLGAALLWTLVPCQAVLPHIRRAKRKRAILDKDSPLYSYVVVGPLLPRPPAQGLP